MGQPDLTSNSLISHPDVFADIINAVVYEGEAVLEERYLRPFYMNSSAVKNNGKLKGLYRDSCMEDVRDGIRYVIWGIENQYVPDRTTPFKVMGYDYTAYDRQIEEFAAQNKKDDTKTYVNGLLPEQKLKPVVTFVLYYGSDDMPDSICAMMDMPKNKNVEKYIQNYKLNMIRLKDLTREQAGMFRSDFACIAEFLMGSYKKEEQIKALKENRQVLIHAKDTLLTLASITRDGRYLKLSETSKEELKMCEIADALEKEGIEKGRLEGIERGRLEGIEKGRLEGIEEGIAAMIEGCNELGVAKKDAYNKIKDKFSLSDWEADVYFKRYWK